ncbi:hypothetical protein HNY73_004490 [Argiope bruennichi]|uniref:Uncharacterized protein n=1 Tax=Argiope bruennichi TaxID=94029 RepID=A0A8T0FW16_ARGBR|nr:hypothetical protein HNY73_004490 [Argiope bruennichi]
MDLKSFAKMDGANQRYGLGEGRVQYQLQWRTTSVASMAIGRFFLFLKCFSPPSSNGGGCSNDHQFRAGGSASGKKQEVVSDWLLHQHQSESGCKKVEDLLGPPWPGYQPSHFPQYRLVPESIGECGVVRCLSGIQTEPNLSIIKVLFKNTL